MNQKKFGRMYYKDYDENKEEGYVRVIQYCNLGYYYDDIKRTDSIIRATANNFTYVKNNWSDSVFLKLDKEENPDVLIRLDASLLFIATATTLKY